MLHLTSIRKGTTIRLSRFLGEERSTGVMRCGFGLSVPQAIIWFQDGRVMHCEFGFIRDDSVFDLLICQESMLKEIKFESSPLRDGQPTMRERSLDALLDNAEAAVGGCGARKWMYGLTPVMIGGQPGVEPAAKDRTVLLDVLHDFETHEPALREKAPAVSPIAAPLYECALLAQAFDSGSARYLTPLVPLTLFDPLIALVQPMDETESHNLLSYQKSLLPHEVAMAMPIERFYAFASAVESVAYRRSSDVGDKARKLIFKIVQKCLGDEGGSGSAVPARPKRPDGPLSTERRFEDDLGPLS